MKTCTCRDGCRCTESSCACKGSCNCPAGCACQGTHKGACTTESANEGCCKASGSCGCQAAKTGSACACAAGCGCCAKAKECCRDGTCPACVGPRGKAPAMGKISWWGAIGLGSTVGIAAWATLYVLGAALAAASGGGPGLLLGLWGGVTASLALAIASASATLALSTRCPVRAVLTGLTLWGLANITLVGMALALDAGLLEHLGGLGRQIFSVGASAIGAAGAADTGASPAPALGAMAGVMVLSLVFALGGGLWARSKISETG